MNQRFYSLDVFRGATVCLMILVNNPGSWGHIYDPLEHAPWHGLTPTDLVFPFFLFAVGNALSFVMPRLEAGGDAAFWKKILKRTALIFLIGLFLNWWPFFKWNESTLIFRQWVDPNNAESGVRIFGVLQRIALCYFFASVIIYYLKPRKAFVAAMILLLAYWMLSYIGNPTDPYSLYGWFGTAVDKKILGVAHMYKGEGLVFDPEGLMSSMSAIVQVIFGFIVGDYIQKKGKSFEMVTGLFVAAVAMLVTGYCWDMVFPINKKIWTSSYTVYTTGLAIITIATMIYFIEFKNAKGWLSRFFDVFGKNALFVFALSAFLPKGFALIRLGDGVNPWNWLYKKVLIHTPGAAENGSFLYAVCVITFMWAICWWMDKKKIYVKV
ncbi:MAG TPA: heparan-alpha-glucosaminide N-acetyltransferase domain-containing protein [Chitinophagaceae bacterium]|nr:heparan-alpha-glucosaminide N-acetyltransferase domain-containing protein [Chitinophagaceae bacterium]